MYHVESLPVCAVIGGRKEMGWPGALTRLGVGENAGKGEASWSVSSLG